MRDFPSDYKVEGQISINDWLAEANPEAIKPPAGIAKNGVLPCRRCLNKSKNKCTSGLRYQGADVICDRFLSDDFMNPPEE